MKKYGLPAILSVLLAVLSCGALAEFSPVGENLPIAGALAEFSPVGENSKWPWNPPPVPANVGCNSCHAVALRPG